MYHWIYNFLSGFDLHGAKSIAYLVTLLAIAAICFIVRLIVKLIVVKVGARVVKKTRSKWDDIFFENKFFHRSANLAVPITLSFFVNTLPVGSELPLKVAQLSGILIALWMFDALIRSIGDVYKLYEISKVRPIHALLQVVSVFAYIIGGIVAVAVLVGQDPLVLIGGLGALSAVFSFIFKDAILGFVAGIQLTSNDMVKIGDWIEVPGSEANGTVTDLSMTTVKVENFDMTVTSVPAYRLVSGSFINWRGMAESGGRRIKRAIYIDMAAVRFCDDELIERLQSIELLRDYLVTKTREIARHNSAESVDPANKANGRQMTNLGTFRAYILRYLGQHPGIHREMSVMVRQLEPKERGIPLEIYAFASTTAWAAYEDIQSDIFDHLLAVVSEFDLRIYQQPSGSDIRSAGLGPETD